MNSRKVSQGILVVVSFLAFAFCFVVASPAYSQVTGARLSGTVTDSSGAIVPQSQISIRNVETDVSTTAVANSDGFYSVPNLIAGGYEVSASAPGFATTVRGGITLTVGAQQVLDLVLQVGQVTQKFEVTTSAPQVELASSSVGGVLGSTEVVELPLNGRDWTQLAALQPSVNALLTQQPTSATNAHRGSRGYGAQLSISGTRPQLNNYRIDGISVVDYVGGAPGSVLGIAMGVDAVAEFSVVTSNYDAEYGRTTGGVVNAITRNGTNQFHGDAYWFLRDEGLDAKNFFDKTIAPFHRNQFGGSAGGPIQKDKTFFFVDYEGLRQDQGITNVDLVPSPAARSGVLNFPGGPATFPSGCVATAVQNQCSVTVDPSVQPYLAFYPLPNAGLVTPGNTGHYDAVATNIGVENFVTGRVDRKFSDKDSVAGTYYYDKGSNSAPDPLQNVLYANVSKRQMVALQETHTVSSSLVNSLRAGFNRVAANDEIALSAINPLAANLSLGAFPGVPAPEISVPGLQLFGGGLGGLTSGRHTWNSFQGYDDAFLTKGLHSLKFGFAVERMQENIQSGATLPLGTYKFGSLASFLTNQPLTFSDVSFSGTHTPPPETGARQTLFGGYLQDDWRVRPSLTVNLGLRYEMVTVPTEVHNHISNLQTITSAAPTLGSPYFKNPSLRDFDPRVGFSWDPFRDGKTAVRGAFGIFDALPLILYVQQNISGVAPFTDSVVASNLPPGSFPTGAFPLATASAPKNLLYGYVEPNPHRNYVMIWNLNVQRQLTPTTSLMVGYVGNHGVHMLDREDDLNSVLPTATPQGYLWPSPAGSGTVLNPLLGDIRGEYWAGDAFYDALEVEVTKRMSHGFQVHGSYTWGKNIDTGSASTHGDPYTNSISSLFFFDKPLRRSLSDFNIAQTLVVNYVWDVPIPKDWGAISSHVLGGWELGGIITAETGVPITPLIAGDPLGLKSSDPYDYPNRLTGPGCASAVNPGNVANYINLSCFAVPNPLTLVGDATRNSVIGPGLVEWDMSLFKNNYFKFISENFNVQFRAELFNVLNRANFQTPTDNESLFDKNGNPISGAGSLDSTSTSAREIQLALKLIF